MPIPDNTDEPTPFDRWIALHISSHSCAQKINFSADFGGFHLMASKIDVDSVLQVSCNNARTTLASKREFPWQ
jgi:hypothetical protein